MINEKQIKPIPKYINPLILKQDKISCPMQKGLRFYSYLTLYKKELMKITVAVKTHKGKRYTKQVAVHGIDSDKCLVKDMEYCGYIGMGYRVGWYEQGLTKQRSWFETESWCSADSKYYNPMSKTINLSLIDKLDKYKYSAYSLYNGDCILKYLRLYTEYPQTEYLLKLGLRSLADKVTILKLIGKDKNFSKWIVRNRTELISNFYYSSVVIKAYRTNSNLRRLQKIENLKKTMLNRDDYKPILELFGNGFEAFYDYLAKQNTVANIYLDYFSACNYLGLDMTDKKNLTPHNFKHCHDARIDECHTAKALKDEELKKELFERFESIATKFTALEKHNSKVFVVIIAKSPNDLIIEGEKLHHCVGKMNYEQKVARGESLIFFLRNKTSSNSPLYTLEYSPEKRKILQCYGENNSKPNDDAEHFINKIWLPYANKQLRKINKDTQQQQVA